MKNRHSQDFMRTIHHSVPANVQMSLASLSLPESLSPSKQGSDLALADLAGIHMLQLTTGANGWQ